jgi:hypothetical protein
MPRKASSRADSARGSWKGLVAALQALAGRAGLKFGRRARIRLVHPEQAFKPRPVDPLLIRSVQMDARALQRMLEAELRRDITPPEPEDQAEREPVRRSG